MPHDHDHDGLEEKGVRVGARTPPPSLLWRWGQRESVNELDKRDKHGVLAYHHRYLHITFGLATAMMWGKAANGQAGSRPFDL
jgi:hypothetical protein